MNQLAKGKSMANLTQVLGIYSKNIKDHTGTGSTQQSRETKTYYYVLRAADEYNVQPLNMQNIPSGLFSALSRNEFIASFTPEISYYQDHPLPELELLKDSLSQGAENFSPASEHEKVQGLIKAFLLEPGKKDIELESPLTSARLIEIVDILSNQCEIFKEEQRQEFNSAAISLRKQELYEEAINFYSKALELSEDENLHFNIARAYFEIGNNTEALMHLDKAIQLAPDLKTAHQFKKYIIKNS